MLVGGQSRMPLVQGRRPVTSASRRARACTPTSAVALGAALLADSLQADRLGDAGGRALHAHRVSPLPGGRFRKVIEKNTQHPSEEQLPPAARQGGQGAWSWTSSRATATGSSTTSTWARCRFPAESAGQRVNFILDEECLLHVTVETASGITREVMLATRDTPDALKAAWQEESERRRLAAERQSASEGEQPRGLFASIRKVFGGE